MSAPGSGVEPKLGLWAAGLDHEITFWRSWFQSGGLSWPDDYRQRFDPDLPLDPVLAEFALASGRDPVRILDVGSGPMTNVGRHAPGVGVELLACDPLAPIYDQLIAEAGVQPPTQSLFAPAEDLSLFFPASSFDIVHCRNALDHSVDPVRSLEEMLRVTRVGGVVVLRHHRNEAEREEYVGLHQWNIDAVGGALVFWNRDIRIEPVKHVGVRVEATAEDAGGDVVAVLTKRGEFPAWDAGERAAERLRSVLRQVTEVLARPALG